MKKIVFLLSLSLFSIATFAQVTAEETDYNYQIAYCVGNQASTAWIGEDLVIMVEGEMPADRDMEIMEEAVAVLSDVVAKYQQFTGMTDLPIASEYDGKPVIEVVIDNCGAGGLASHGVLGMSTGTYFLDGLYNNLQNNNVAVPQVFLYELNRNFWRPDFNNKFDWAMNNEPANWGWWTVGMNNAQAVMVPISLGIEMDYFGNDLAYFRDRMVGELTDYMEDDQYDFDYGWTQSLMPWHDTESINDLMSGLLIYSYENFGGENWLTNFYQYIQDEDIENRSDVFAFQECRDNVYKIWSYSAEEDLIEFFEDDLRWIISEDAKETIDEHFNPPPEPTSITSIDNKILIYPNPATDQLNIELGDSQTSSIEIFNALGQRVYNQAVVQDQVSIDISHLVEGVYYIKYGMYNYTFSKQ